MPFYEYRRPDGTTFEVSQKMSDPTLVNDPETGVPVTRVYHPVAVHFKGKGFYNTDYGTKKRSRETEQAASDGADKHDDKRKAEKETKSTATADSSSSNESSSSNSSESKSSESKSSKPSSSSSD